ncbi:MAG: hypothetical protein JO235_00395 [Chroococcidiopsidaceae cyanobacterium CP_BM_RX_35]|nr:hypothetical protein [Chroococcidiopsidaceae cyanobacterium CP_BM_RX_35]
MTIQFLSLINSTGTFVNSITGNLDYPTGIAFNNAGNLYATNLYNNTISKFTPSSTSSVPEPSEILGTLAFATLAAGYLVKRQIKKVTVSALKN